MQSRFFGAINMLMKNRGFTLTELMVTLAVAAILAALTVPSMTIMLQGNKVVGIANDLVGVVSLARSEAVRRNATVSVDSTAGAANWAGGWIIYVDQDSSGAYNAPADTLIQEIDGTGSGVEVVPTNPLATLSFRPNGLSAIGAQVVVNICADDLPITQQRILTISLSGRVSVRQTGVNLC